MGREWAVLVGFGMMPYETFGASPALPHTASRLPVMSVLRSLAGSDFDNANSSIFIRMPNYSHIISLNFWVVRTFVTINEDLIVYLCGKDNLLDDEIG